jgi:hypothetical protein
MPERYAKVKIGGTWLTADGTESAPAARCVVRNESAFASLNIASSEQALDFTVHTQVAARGLSGIPFAVTAPYLGEAQIAAIVAELDGALSSLSDVRVISDGQVPFDVLAVPVPTGEGALYTFESRSGGIARGVTFQFISTGAGGE